MQKYEVPSTILNILSAINDYKKEVNDTLQKYESLKKSIDQFNKIITSQLEWIKLLPDGLDSEIIQNNIESMLYNYFDKNDIINLFKNYRKTYIKMMLMISFVPKEFIYKETCIICLTNARDIVLVPCGHTCCNNCVQNITSCMICRKKFDKKQKIYN